jgi:hypothetical protein
MRIYGWILRSVLAVNFLLFVLTFIAAFSGIGREPGLADYLWGNYRFDGWRADVAWIFVSSVFIFTTGRSWIRKNRSEEITQTAWSIWKVCFPIYLFYIFIHMFG